MNYELPYNVNQRLHPFAGTPRLSAVFDLENWGDDLIFTLFF